MNTKLVTLVQKNYLHIDRYWKYNFDLARKVNNTDVNIELIIRFILYSLFHLSFFSAYNTQWKIKNCENKIKQKKRISI